MGLVEKVAEALMRTHYTYRGKIPPKWDVLSADSMEYWCAMADAVLLMEEMK